jgi:hypothetical protein
MSVQFFYVHLKFIPKIVTLTAPMLRRRDVVVKFPKRLAQLRQSELENENPGEQAIALDLARGAALGTFPTVTVARLFQNTSRAFRRQLESLGALDHARRC